ncbi:hypothetical protein L7J86_00015 [endosymbiont of Metamasius hemipterus]|uniref:Uncharacterized protein n=1 Tax=endosymbiont of Metamasius hemipterus TaxID=204627 RepID=A0ABT0TW31_9GAMM|nr:hypothetical protein [endosymbiont of Metamasius hemipterus]
MKYQNLSEYKIQKRGGRGKILINLKNNLDELKITCISNTYDDLLLFSNLGKVYILKTYEISKFNKYNLGKLINNIFSLLKNEYITYIISIKLNNLINKKTYLIICLNNGIIKKL